jgi:hypothetical protein
MGNKKAGKIAGQGIDRCFKWFWNDKIKKKYIDF